MSCKSVTVNVTVCLVEVLSASCHDASRLNGWRLKSRVPRCVQANRKTEGTKGTN